MYTELLALMALGLGRTAASKGGLLQEPGDSLSLGGIEVTLHEDQQGNLFASVASTTSIKTYGDHTHTHSFEAAARVEDHLRDLKARRLDKTTNWSTTVIQGTATEEGTDCDCELATLNDVAVVTQPRRVRWVFHHEETSLVAECPIHEGQIFETTITQPGLLRPICLITPTRWMADLLQKMRDMDPTRLMEEMNDWTDKPCVVEGSYNLRTLPRGRSALKEATSMIDCALQCLFVPKCSTWTFDHEGAPRCWIINTGYLRPTFNKAAGGQFVTGGKECLPCILRRKIEVSGPEGKTDARRLCDLDTQTKWATTPRCACSQEKTISAHEHWIQTANHEADRNSIWRQERRGHGSMANTLDRILRELRTTHRGLAGLGTALLSPIKPGTRPANWTHTLPLIKKLASLLGPQAKIYSKIVPVGDLTQPLHPRHPNHPHYPIHPSMRTVRNHSTTAYHPVQMAPERDIKRLGAGTRATSNTVRHTLQAARAFLAASEHKKGEILRMEGGIPGYTELIEDPNIEIPGGANALTVGIDMGSEVAQMAVFPHEGTAESRTVIAIPLPTKKSPPGLETSIIRGSWTSPNLYNRKHLVEELPEMCALELLSAMKNPLHCEGTGDQRERKAFNLVTVDHKGTTTRMARFHTNAELQLPYTITCGNEMHLLDLLGITLIAIGEACNIKDGTGKMLTQSIGTKTQEEVSRSFKILFNRHLQAEPSPLDAKETIQLTLAVGLLISLITVMMCKCKKRLTRENQEAGATEHADETELEELHPETGTPRRKSPPRE